MGKTAFITGSSKGIGKALTLLLLKENYSVIGYSRTNTISHPNFTHVKIDLSNLKEVQNINFPSAHKDDVLLINNAANLGEIMPLHLKNSSTIIKDYNLNIITPTLLCSIFINIFLKNKKTIINVSSGAAKSDIPSWSTYCATKSALDRLTTVLSEETHEKLNVFSIHPGIVDTSMQKSIREADGKLFPMLDRFIKYHEDNELEDADKIAEKFYYVIKNKDKFSQKILFLRDISI